MSTKEICKHFEITCFIYYRWKKNHQKEASKQSMERRIGELCGQLNFRYGYSKIMTILRKEISINHKVVQRVMQKYSCKCHVKVKKWKQIGHPSLYNYEIIVFTIGDYQNTDFVLDTQHQIPTLIYLIYQLFHSKLHSISDAISSGLPIDSV